MKIMLKNILNLEGTQEITANEQKLILGNYAKENVSKCNAWDYVSSMSYEDCTDYFALEMSYSDALVAG
ncbi:hypothetical protein EYY60_17285 [Flavobacterium zhairuonense]|uniref:hypothetical protein n=1 Tax=Flavobacterium zhairuonense TaxID=2493631 RepID=UPI001044975D|nr:hypothetical protein [Flavobacterium zhairuonense]KAF2507706.1 hypothetical protein EYY60_17285 [Flavobacterium zhairuonense]